MAEEGPSFTPLVIDLSPFLQPPHVPPDEKARAETVSKLREAISGAGLFFLIGHGILIGEEVMAAARRFFRLPSSAKASVPSVQKDGFTRGYIPIFGESGRAAEYRELKEAFSYGYPWDPSRRAENPLQGCNVWPGEGQGLQGAQAWQDLMTAFFFEMVRVWKGLCGALSLCLGLEEGCLWCLCEGGDSISLMRVFHYLCPTAHPMGQGHDVIGSSPHTDWGFLTLILQDSVGGLEVRDPQGGQWVAVKALEGALVVNCGDYLSLLAHHLCPSLHVHSPVHRVTSPSPSPSGSTGQEGGGEGERYSFVFFAYPSYTAPLPLPSQSQTSTQDCDHGYNTLLQQQQHSTDASAPVSFGEHLGRKWAGVQTQAPLT